MNNCSKFMTMIQLYYVYDNIGNDCWTVGKLTIDQNMEKG